MKKSSKKIIFVFLTAVSLFGAVCFSFAWQQKIEGRPYFSFAYLSDTHISEGANAIEDLQACVKEINDNPNLKFVIFAGDITDFGSDNELKLAKSIIDNLNKPYYIVAGNHDAKWSESGCNTFAKVFGYEHFAFEESGIQFIGTNCGPTMIMAPALLPRESMVWLDSLVNVIPAEKPVIFVNHYPMDTSMLNYFQVLDKIKKMNTQLILSGHWHQNRAMDYEGIPAAIGRSSLRNGQEGAGYNIITIDGSTVTFRERIAQQIQVKNDEKQIVKGRTKSPRHTLRMSRGVPFASDVQYPHPDYSVNSRYPGIKELWRVEDRSDIGSGAVISGEIVIYANTSGMVYALNAGTGAKKWRFKAGGKIFSTPEISGNSVVFGCTDGIIYSLEKGSGKLLWKFKCEKSVLGSPVIQGGKVFIGASDNRFRAIDLKSGRLVWNYDQIKGFIEAKPYVDSKQVVIGDWANTLYSFDPSNGKLQWTWTNKGSRMLSPAAVWPVKAYGKIFFVTPERITYAIGAETGWQFWKAKGGRESVGLSPDERQLYVKTMKDTVIAYNTQRNLPEKVWTSNVGFGYEIAPTPITSVGGVGKEGKGLLFVPTDKGNIVALNCTDGSIAWRHRVGFALVNYIQPVGKNKLLVSTMDGVVALLQLPY